MADGGRSLFFHRNYEHATSSAVTTNNHGQPNADPGSSLGMATHGGVRFFAHTTVRSSFWKPKVVPAREGIAGLCTDTGAYVHLESDCQVLIDSVKSAEADRLSACFSLRDLDRQVRISWIARSGQFAREKASSGLLIGSILGLSRVS